jgi:FkbM family methyltransferase
LTGKLKYLNLTQTLSDSLKELLPCDEIDTCFDGGAYKGDTLRVMSEAFPELKEVFCVEPDPVSFRKLKEFSDNFKNLNIILHNVVLSDKKGSSVFFSSSGRGAGINGMSRRASSVTIERNTVDAILDGKSVDYIKLDVEGEEYNALRGAEKTIRIFKPFLSVSVYHRTDDFLLIPDLIRSFNPCYRLFFRRQNCIPMWDLDLFALREM